MKKVMLLLLVCFFALQSFACGDDCSTSIASSFNGTSITAGRKIWFSAVLKVSGHPTYPLIIYFSDQVIASYSFAIHVPDGELILDPSVTAATTVFDGTRWVTTAPPSMSGNYFISGYADSLLSWLPGGLNPVIWSGKFLASRSSVSLNWQWAAAVYTSFSADLAILGVKASDCSSCTIYANSDHAGTPESYKSRVVGGARGGGGSNYTGSYSGTAYVSACADVIPAPTTAAITGASAVCVGATTALSDATPGGIWSSSNTAIATVSSSGVVTGISAGTVTISYSTTTFGTTAATTTLTVNPLPAVTPITGAVTTICAGGATTLSDATPGGTWSSSNPMRAHVSSSGLVTSVTWGTVIISYTITNSCGAASATQTVVMNAVPAVMPVTGGGPYCPGTSGVAVTLPGSAVGINYQLYRHDTAIGTPVPGAGCGISMGLQTIPGTYTVIATNPATGCSSNMSCGTTVSIAPLPDVFSVTGGGSYCFDGTGVHISLSGSDTATTYELLLNGVPVDSIYAGTGTALDFGAQTDSGIYTVHASSTVTGCADNMSGSASVAISGLPYAGCITGPSSVHRGSSITLTDSAGSGIWLSSDSTIVSICSTTGIATGVSMGFVNITYEVTNTCGTAMTTFTVHGLGGHDGSRSSATSKTPTIAEQMEALLYPNPNNGSFTIGLPETFANGYMTITITDVTGKIVYQNATMRPTTSVQVQPVEPLLNGAYLIGLRSGDNSAVLHMVVEH